MVYINMNQSDTELMKKYVEITPDLNTNTLLMNVYKDITRIVWDETMVESKLTNRRIKNSRFVWYLYHTCKNGKYKRNG